MSRVRLSNIRNLAGTTAPDILWREFRALQTVSTPTLATQINADGYSDNVTVAATLGLSGTLTWTLFGPVAAGPGNSCTGRNWVGAPVFATGTMPITGDGVVVTTPPTPPTTAGCYSYQDVLSGPSYTANATSAVGQPLETFFVAGPPSPSISLVKSASPSDAASFNLNQVITYSFVVTNTGNVPLSAVTVAETAFDGENPMSTITCPGGNGTVVLAPAAQVTCTATYTLVQADLDQGSITNTAIATGTPPVGTSVSSAPSSTTVPGLPAPGISLAKSVSPEVANTAGDVVTYSFLITNTGNVSLSNVTATEVTFSGAPTPAVVCPAAAASVQPGGQVTCTASYTLTQADVDAGQVTNTATSRGTPPTGPNVVSTPDDALVTIALAPAITLVKSAAGGPFTRAAQVVRYSFSVTNTGNVTLTAVGITETDFTGNGAMTTPVCATTTLAPTVSTTCTASYTLTQEDVDSGEVSNTATSRGTPPTGAAVDSNPSSAVVLLSPAADRRLPPTGGDTPSFIWFVAALLFVGGLTAS